VTPFKHLKAPAEKIQSQVDSLLTVVRRARTDYLAAKNREVPPEFGIHIDIFAPDIKTPNDNYYVNLHMTTGSSTSAWTALYRIVGDSAKYDVFELYPPSDGPGVYGFNCSVDIDGDGTDEILIMEPGGASVYNLIDNRLIRRCSSGYRGC